MIYYKGLKLYSIREITSSSFITRKEILEYEKIGIIKPYYQDKKTSFRYYEPSIILKLNLIKKLEDSGFDSFMIKNYFLNTLDNKAEIISLLNKKKNSIEESLLLFSRFKTFTKKIKAEIIYYFEERTLFSLENISSLFNEIYIHALEKKYIFTDLDPFIIFPIDLLNYRKIDKDNIVKTKFCIPIKTRYDEKNISIFKRSEYLEYKDSINSFFSSINNINLSIKINNFKCKGSILYSYSQNLVDNENEIIVHKFLIPLF